MTKARYRNEIEKVALVLFAKNGQNCGYMFWAGVLFTSLIIEDNVFSLFGSSVRRLQCQKRSKRRDKNIQRFLCP